MSENNTSVISPRFGASLVLSPITKINFAIGKFYQTPSYSMLLNHLEHEIVQLKLTNSIAYYEVVVMDEKKAYYKFNWQVEKYEKEGFLKDCWLTTIVSAPIPLGSSI